MGVNSKKYNTLEENTFGKSPAAIYLVNTLNELKDPRLSSKVGRFLSDKRNLLSSIEQANKANILTSSQVSAICNLLRGDIDFKCNNTLVENLTNNIVRGHISSILRRSAKLTIVESQQVSFTSKVKTGKMFPTKLINSDGLVVGYVADLPDDELTQEELERSLVKPKYHINDMKDVVTNDTLNEKWRARMKRTGKVKVD